MNTQTTASLNATPSVLLQNAPVLKQGGGHDLLVTSRSNQLSAKTPKQSFSSTMVSTENPHLRAASSSKSKDVFWCVDKAWSEPAQTLLCSIPDKDEFLDDDSLCKRLSQEYDRVRGRFAVLFSWKKCMDVRFIKVMTHRLSVASLKKH